MSLSAFQNLIVELAQSIGATGMAANDDGYVGLTIDDRDVHVQYEPEDDVVVLFARLQEVEPERRAALYSMLLAANVFWQATRGATFSADFDTGRVFLADRRNRADLDLESLSVWIEGFANVVALWWDRIESANEGGPLSNGSGDVPAAGTGMPSAGTFA
ncbi:MAG: type III secretion system chaperone [Burkholderiaceae bacterium]|nr:type III secretion system chaperone [Burkholderiaceae bacterium]